MSYTILDIARLLPGDNLVKLSETKLLTEVSEALEDPNVRQVVCISPRRCGKSTAAACACLKTILQKEGSYCIWISGAGTQSESIVSQKIAIPLQKSPLKGILRVCRARVDNPCLNSTLEVACGTDETAVGRSCDLVVIDEARAINEELYERIQLSASGENQKILIISSPSAPGHWLHKIVEDPPSNTKVLRFYDSSINPSVSKEFLKTEAEKAGKGSAWQKAMWERELCGQFITLAEQPLLDPGRIQEAAKDEIEPYNANTDTVYIGADLSLSRDLTSIVAVAKRDDNFRIIHQWFWDPKKDGIVDYEIIENHLFMLDRKYHGPEI